MHILASQSNLFYFILFFNEVYAVPFKGQLGCRQSTPETDNWSSAILLDIASKQSAYQTVSWRSLLHPETCSPLSLSESWLSSRNTAYMAHGVQRGFSTRPRGTPTCYLDRTCKNFKLYFTSDSLFPVKHHHKWSWMNTVSVKKRFQKNKILSKN